VTYPVVIARRLPYGLLLAAPILATSPLVACDGEDTPTPEESVANEESAGHEGTASPSDADPRCVALCTIDEPAVEDAFDVCSADSMDPCIATCEIRIAGVASLCASCLLEDACFHPSCRGGGGGGEEGGDEGGVCVVSGREGDCSYTCEDQQAYEDCLAQVYPRRTVSCEPVFAPVVECAEVC
jgi:hypothetical protein